MKTFVAVTVFCLIQMLVCRVLGNSSQCEEAENTATSCLADAYTSLESQAPIMDLDTRCRGVRTLLECVRVAHETCPTLPSLAKPSTRHYIDMLVEFRDAHCEVVCPRDALDLMERCKDMHAPDNVLDKCRAWRDFVQCLELYIQPCPQHEQTLKNGAEKMREYIARDCR